MADVEPLGEPVHVNGHRMQHSSGPSWCIDCGEFYPELEACKAEKLATFDQREPEGARNISACIRGEE